MSFLLIDKKLALNPVTEWSGKLKAVDSHSLKTFDYLDMVGFQVFCKSFHYLFNWMIVY